MHELERAAKERFQAQVSRAMDRFERCEARLGPGKAQSPERTRDLALAPGPQDSVRTEYALRLVAIVTPARTHPELGPDRARIRRLGHRALHLPLALAPGLVQEPIPRVITKLGSRQSFPPEDAP